MVTPQSGIRNSIKEKSGKYGELDLPYIIAINVVDQFSGDDIDISNALFGDEQVIFTFRGNKVIREETRRKRNGAWFGPKGPRNTRVSGALFASLLSPWNIAKITPVLWHHPWANKPLSPEWLPFPQFLGGEGHFLKELKWKNGWELLGLDPNWPEEKGNHK